MADFDPYRIWLGIPPKEQPPNHYRLLGVGLFESDPDAISNAADRQMVHVRTFQSGKHSKLSQRLLNELAAARVCMLDPQKKVDYDARLRKELAASQPGPPPPRATVPAPPAANSGLPVSASHQWDMENAPPNGRVLPPVQTASDTFSGTTRPTRLATRRKQSAWYGAATTIVLVGLALVLVVWALNRSESEPPDKSDPAVKRNGNGTSNSRPPKRPRKQPNHRLRPTNPSANGGPDQGTANVLPSGPGNGSNVAGTVGEIRVFQGHTNRATGAVFSPDEASILSGSDDKSVRLWDVSTGAERLLEGSKKPILAVAFSPDGETVLATCGHTNPPSGGMLHLWAAAGGQRTHRRIDVSNAGIAWDAKFAPNGRLIAPACEDASIRLLDTSDKKNIKEINQLMGHNGAVRSVAFSPDGSKILSGGADYDVCLWDLANGKEIRRMIGHQGAVTGVAFSPDGNSALSGGVDKTVRLWDVATGELRQTFQGHVDAVTCVACTPDGQMALSGGLDRTIRIWRFSDGVEVHQFSEPQGSVRSIAVSADSRRAVSAGDDAVVRLWRLPDLSSGSVKTPIAGNDLPGPRPDDQGTQPTRIAVPDAQSLQKAEDLIRKAYKKEFEAAQQPSGKLALARKLLAETLKPQEKFSEEPHATYALLRMAKEYATEVAAVDTAFAAVDEIAARYEIEALRTKIETLEAACQVNTASRTKKLLARKALAVLDEALAADDFDAAERLIGTARAAMSRAPTRTCASCWRREPRRRTI